MKNRPTPQSRYRQRMLAKGYRRCQLWLHRELEGEVRKLAKERDEERAAREVLRKTQGKH